LRGREDGVEVVKNEMIKKQAEKKGERKSFGHNKRRSSDCFNPFGVIIRQ